MLNFSLDEFECPCCRELPLEFYPNVRRLIDEILDPIRTVIRCPISVSSGYRCNKRNGEVGGADKSFHLKGAAADIFITDQARFESIIQFIDFNWNGGMGIYRTDREELNFIHLDIGNRRRW